MTELFPEEQEIKVLKDEVVLLEDDLKAAHKKIRALETMLYGKPFEEEDQ